jgi:hypothetical protein
MGELDLLIFTNGGNSNGTTNTDRTSYYEARQVSEDLADIGVTVNINAGGGGGGGGRGAAPAGGTATITVSSPTENFDAGWPFWPTSCYAPHFRRTRSKSGEAGSAAPSSRPPHSPIRFRRDADEGSVSGDTRQFTRLRAESLGRITREDLMEHYKKYYVPSGERAGI